MKNNKPNTVEAARAAISQGFTTKVQKKSTKDILDRAMMAVARAAGEAGMSREDLTWNMPDGCHAIGAKAVKLLTPFPVQLEAALEIKAVYLELKAVEIVKIVKVDDTKVRELGPQAATTAGIDYIDSNGDRRGFCYCCSRIGFMLNDLGRLSRHGYQRPGWGYDVGGCSGSGRTPERTLEIAIAWHGQEIARREELLATDLIGFALKQSRRHWKMVRREGRRTYEVRGDYARSNRAREYRMLRDQDANVTSITSPAVWRTLLERENKTHTSQRNDLLAVQAAI
tara:strand:+ start:5324 stop:6175 length:852 start_codon:yes stop_codon:yes gene_type:complete